MFKKTAIVATAAAGLLMIGSPAFATSPDEADAQSSNNSQFGLININDVLSHNNILCDVLDLNLIAVLGANVSGDTTCATVENTNAEASNAEATNKR